MLCFLVLIFFLFRFIRKYGLSTEYLLNFKNNILFKSRNNSGLNENNHNSTTHTVHSSILNFKKPKNQNFFSDSQNQIQQPQYQLQNSANARFNSNLLTMPSSHNTEIMSKNPTFNYGNFCLFFVFILFLFILCESFCFCF